MKELNKMLKAFWTDEEGVTVVEYAVLVALIIIVLISSIAILTGGIGDLFEGAGNRLTTESAKTAG